MHGMLTDPPSPPTDDGRKPPAGQPLGRSERIPCIGGQQPGLPHAGSLASPPRHGGRRPATHVLPARDHGDAQDLRRRLASFIDIPGLVFSSFPGLSREPVTAKKPRICAAIGGQAPPKSWRAKARHPRLASLRLWKTRIPAQPDRKTNPPTPRPADTNQKKFLIRSLHLCYHHPQ